MFRVFRRKRTDPPKPPEQAPPPEPPIRELGELPHVDLDAIQEAEATEPASGVVGELRAQKLAGLRERAERLAQEQQRAAEAAAKQEERRNVELERDRLLARRVLRSLPELIRQAAARGLDAAVLANAFVAEAAAEPSDGVVTIDGRAWALGGWLAPFHTLCEEAGVPLTVVSERVEIDRDPPQHRVYHVLAVDLARL